MSWSECITLCVFALCMTYVLTRDTQEPGSYVKPIPKVPPPPPPPQFPWPKPTRSPSPPAPPKQK